MFLRMVHRLFRPSLQFLFTGTHTREDIATEAYEDELDMGHSGSCLNSSITSAWSEHSLDPEDIRVRHLHQFSEVLDTQYPKNLTNICKV